MAISFELQLQRGAARRGRLVTPHGSIETPEFMPVGTQATVKAISPRELEEVQVQGVLANTYHLYLRPGSKLVQELGGLHKFMGWNKPIMTDSGGFQAFSLGAGRDHGVGKIGGVFPAAERTPRVPKGEKASVKMVKIDEEGVRFRSHLDGSSHKLTPELSIQIQEELGADMILAFDECTSPLADRRYTEYALHRTHRWAVRSLEARRDTPQGLYGIIQGGSYQDLRELSLEFLTKMPFEGFAVGGSLGRNKEEMMQVLDWTVPGLPPSRPRHLLGIGEIDDLIGATERGIDTFDCVIPTRFARYGHVLVPPGFAGRSPKGTLSLKNATYARDPGPIDPNCTCYCCRNFSRAYLRHLIKAEEILASQLATLHNLHFMMSFTRAMRAALEQDRWQDFKREWGQ